MLHKFKSITGNPSFDPLAIVGVTKENAIGKVIIMLRAGQIFGCFGDLETVRAEVDAAIKAAEDREDERQRGRVTFHAAQAQLSMEAALDGPDPSPAAPAALGIDEQFDFDKKNA